MIFEGKSLAYFVFFNCAFSSRPSGFKETIFLNFPYFVYLLAYLEYLGVEQKLNFGSFTENIIRIWK